MLMVEITFPVSIATLLACERGFCKNSLHLKVCSLTHEEMWWLGNNKCLMRQAVCFRVQTLVTMRSQYNKLADTLSGIFLQY